MKRLSFVFLFFLIYFLTTSDPIFAQSNDQFITIVNPVRISAYNTDPKNSLISQYQEVAKRNLPATWLLTFDAIENPGIREAISQMDKKQELGIFIEVSENFATPSGVTYQKTDSWHRANSIFLSGYTQGDRIKLIDKVFESFKKYFGFYPKSVGAWWVDSFSLNYMVQKYGISANLTCADQFSTDGYQLWGQPWSTPFYPSKNHAGMPASNLEQKLNVVTMQWAPRDPLNGYGPGRSSLYSTQDYFTINLKDDYFKKLIELYSKKQQNHFGQITLGLEADFPPGNYTLKYADWVNIISQYENSGEYRVTTMQEFSNWYQQKFPNLSSVYITQSPDLLGGGLQTVWYQSPYYRINLVYDQQEKQLKIRDLRVYQQNYQEPYYLSPNRQLDLAINIPSVIDTVNNPKEEFVFSNLTLENAENQKERYILKFSNGQQIKLTEKSFSFSGFSSQPKLFDSSVLLNAVVSGKNITFTVKEFFPFDSQGYHLRSLTPEGSYFLKQKKVLVVGGVIILAFVVFALIIKRSKLGKKQKLFRILVIASPLITALIIGMFWYTRNSKEYFVSQSELDSLYRLTNLPPGKVMVLNKDCLQCSFQSPIQPAIFANKRDYVGQLSKHPIVYNQTVFTAKTRSEAKKQLQGSQVKYVYLVSYEDYAEQMPFSPGDLGVEKIYQNANAQIWRIK